MNYLKTRAIHRGICCNNCQEDVNFHCCKVCNGLFMDNDIIYCEYHSQEDCNHLHKTCYEKIKLIEVLDDN